LADQRKQAKLQWLQNPSEASEDNLSDVRRETRRHYRKKQREYPKDKIKKLESSSKYKNIRGLYRGKNEFKKDYQHRTNLVKDERGDLLEDPHKILNRWKNYFCQLLNVRAIRKNIMEVRWVCKVVNPAIYRNWWQVLVNTMMNRPVLETRS
jgi:hypothetical protein